MSDWRLFDSGDVIAALGGTWSLAILQGSLRGWQGSAAIGLAATAGILANYATHRGGAA